MRCAYLIPTANHALASECFAAWRSMGWDCYAAVEGDADIANATGVIRQDEYPGWGESFNRLAREVAGRYDWLATGGDDCFPDLRHDAKTIGFKLSTHFGGTMGVCQATFDRWAWDKHGNVSPICFAPFIGAEFARRWNGGNGAFWPGYFQWWGDRELYEVAKGARLLIERPDWHIEHRHVAKVGAPSPHYKVSKHHRWQADADLFASRSSAGFPDHQPIA